MKAGYFEKLSRIETINTKTIFQCDTASKTIDALTANRSEVITVPYGRVAKNLYTITGKVTGCDNAVLANQPFQMAVQEMPEVSDCRELVMHSNYTVTAMICNNSASITAQASAFVNNEYRYAAAVNITSASGKFFNAKDLRHRFRHCR